MPHICLFFHQFNFIVLYFYNCFSYSRSNYENRWIIWKILDLLGAGGVSVRPDEIEFSMELKFVADEVPDEVEKVDFWSISFLLFCLKDASLRRSDEA